uniref:Uncharacterized protein n=1 Tax=Anguilla anguilla TaxID=7936 RepID=A0A0E9PNQ2_ANGAN
MRMCAAVQKKTAATRGNRELKKIRTV